MYAPRVRPAKEEKTLKYAICSKDVIAYFGYVLSVKEAVDAFQ
ncbi:hypothetical protein PR003_g24284 [Phytophthora rubi]|uniref:Uncharacterized protein n=1 Tax=Phytophthora rubi TaxID=129364 RepID=A0A6A4CSA5_9STRA|nr:hypothetical protein PR001_g25920 [Phytophthora rubi]KAE9294341.1 hypothetical protein PR003_g24284 [Phytophthora rubi]